MGKATQNEINQAFANLLHARENQIELASRIWLNFYELQKLTMHDLTSGAPLTADFDILTNLFKNEMCKSNTKSRLFDKRHISPVIT